MPVAVIVLIVIFVVGTHVTEEQVWTVVKVIGGAILAIWLLVKYSQQRSRERARNIEERRRQEAEAAAAERKRQEEKQRAEAAAFAAEQEQRYQAARRAGKDACGVCKAIEPDRCECGKCIAARPCNYDAKDGECSDCNHLRRTRSCREAEARGDDVCWECLTPRPERCYCGRCVSNCNAGTTSGCNVCD
jgi:hypothetical protein